MRIYRYSAGVIDCCQFWDVASTLVLRYVSPFGLRLTFTSRRMEPSAMLPSDTPRYRSTWNTTPTTKNRPHAGDGVGGGASSAR